MATFCIHETGEVITCNCFFDFWIYHVNHEKRAKFADLNDILQKVSTEDIKDYLGYYPSIFIKKRTITFEDDSPCVMITIC